MRGSPGAHLALAGLLHPAKRSGWISPAFHSHPPSEMRSHPLHLQVTSRSTSPVGNALYNRFRRKHGRGLSGIFASIILPLDLRQPLGDHPFTQTGIHSARLPMWSNVLEQLGCLVVAEVGAGPVTGLFFMLGRREIGPPTARLG